jgi:hypothetical protein
VYENIIETMLVPIVVDRYRFDADPDPDTTCHIDINRPNFLILYQVLRMCVKSDFFTVIHSSARIHCFIFLDSFIGVIIFNIWDSIFKFSGKKYSFAVPNWIMMMLY